MMQEPAPTTTPYIGAWMRTFDFVGRSSRTEYWTFYLINVAITAAAVLIFRESLGSGIATVPILVVFLPTLAVTVRRLRDGLGSGAWFFLAFIPFVGPLVVFWILPLLPSRPIPVEHAGYEPGSGVDRTQSWGNDSAGGGDDPWNQR